VRRVPRNARTSVATAKDAGIESTLIDASTSGLRRGHRQWTDSRDPDQVAGAQRETGVTGASQLRDGKRDFAKSRRPLRTRLPRQFEGRTLGRVG